MHKRVLTFGTFDHLHPGHIAYLTEAQSKGDLFIIVARDQNVAHIKGKSSDQNEEDRKKALEEVFPEATVLLGDQADYLKPVLEIQPDMIVMGYDQHLPPGISEEDLPCPVERAAPHKPEEYKSSLRLKRKKA